MKPGYILLATLLLLTTAHAAFCDANGDSSITVGPNTVHVSFLGKDDVTWTVGVGSPTSSADATTGFSAATQADVFFIQDINNMLEADGHAIADVIRDVDLSSVWSTTKVAYGYVDGTTLGGSAYNPVSLLSFDNPSCNAKKGGPKRAKGGKKGGDNTGDPFDLCVADSVTSVLGEWALSDLDFTTGHQRVVVVFTVNPVTEVSDFLVGCESKGIIPYFVVPNALKSSYQAVIDTLGYGGVISASMNSFEAEVVSTLVPFIEQDLAALSSIISVQVSGDETYSVVTPIYNGDGTVTLSFMDTTAASVSQWAQDSNNECGTETSLPCIFDSQGRSQYLHAATGNKDVPNPHYHKIFICHVPGGYRGCAESAAVSGDIDAKGCRPRVIDLDIDANGWKGHSQHSSNFCTDPANCARDSFGGCDCPDDDWDTVLSFMDPNKLPVVTIDFLGFATYTATFSIPEAPPTPDESIVVDATVGASTQIEITDALSADALGDLLSAGYDVGVKILWVGTSPDESIPSISNSLYDLTTCTGGANVEPVRTWDFLARQCPIQSETCLNLTPLTCTEDTTLYIRYQLCNGCYCAGTHANIKNGRSADTAGALIRINLSCPEEVVTCAPTTAEVVEGNSVDIDLRALSAINGAPDAKEVLAFGVANAIVSEDDSYSITDGVLTFNAGSVPETVTLTYVASATGDVSCNSDDCVSCEIQITKRADKALTVYPDLSFNDERETASTAQTFSIDFKAADVTLRVLSSDIVPAHVNYVRIDGAPLTSGWMSAFTMTGATQTFSLEWSPSRSFPDDTTYTVVFEAVSGDKSDQVSVTFTVPNNECQPAITAPGSVIVDEDATTVFEVSASVEAWNSVTFSVATEPRFGSLTSTGNGSPVELTYTPRANYNGADSFVVAFTDSFGCVSRQTISITVNPINDAPTSASQAYTGVQNGDVINMEPIVANDIDGDSISLVIVTDVQGTVLGDFSCTATNSGPYTGGETLLMNDNRLQCTFTAGAFAVDQVITFRVTDGIVDSPEYTITFSPASDVPPVCEDYTTEVAEDSQVTFSLNGLFFDSNRDTIGSINVGALNGDGILSGNFDRDNNLNFVGGAPGPVTYTPPADAHSFSVTFDYTVTTTPNVATCTGTVTINVLPVNDPPTFTVTPTDISVARGDSDCFTVTVNDIDSTEIFVHLNDVDLTAGSNTLVADGVYDAVDGSSGRVGSYAPGASFDICWSPGADVPVGASGSAVVAVNDGELSATPDQQITFTTAGNVPPRHVSPTSCVEIEEDSPRVTITVLGTDDDAADFDNLEIRAWTAPEHGQLTPAAPSAYKKGDPQLDGTSFDFGYKPNKNYNGPDSFSVLYRDNLGRETEATIDICVSAVNDAPTCSSISSVIAVQVDSSTTFSLTAADADSTFDITFSGDEALKGTLTLNGLDVTYDSTSENEEPTTVQFTVSDEEFDVTCSFTIAVSGEVPPDLPPAVTDGSASTPEDVCLPVAISSLAVDAEDGSSVTIVLQTVTSNGVLYTNYADVNLRAAVVAGTSFAAADASFTYCPQSNFNGVDTFTFDAKDSKGQRSSSTATFTIDVTPVNDPPTLSITPVESLNVARGSCASFTGRITDIDSDTVHWNVASFAGVPVPSTITVDGGADVLALTGDIATFANPNMGSEITFTFDWCPGYALPDRSSGYFSSTARDAESAFSSSRKVTVGVAANTPPTADDTAVSGTEGDAAIAITLSGNDAESNVEDLTFQILSQPTSGSLSAVTVDTVANDPEATASVNFVPADPDFCGAVTFTYTTTDHLGLVSSPATVTVDIACVNDCPVVRGGSDVSRTIVAGESTSVSISASDVDAGTSLGLVISNMIIDTGATLTVNGQPVTEGVAISGSSWTMVYTSADTYDGVDSFTYAVDDGSTDDCGSFVVTITSSFTPPPPPENNAPVAEDVTVVIDENTCVDVSFSYYDVPVDGEPPNAVRDGSFVSGNRQLLKTTSGQMPSRDVYSQGGVFTYTYCPPTDACGFDEVYDYTVTDSPTNGAAPATSNVASITISVQCVNKPPTCQITPSSTTVGRTDTATLSYTATDPDGDTLTVTLAATTSVPTPSVLSLDTDGNAISYTPAEDVSGTSGRVVLAVSDGEFTVNCAGNLRIAANNPPVTTLPTNTQEGPEDEELAIVLQGTDADSYHSTVLAVTIRSLPASGTLLDANRNEIVPGQVIVSRAATDATEADVIYVPDADYNGPDAFSFDVMDKAGAVSSSRTVDILITPVDDAPVAANYDIYINEDDCLGLNCAVVTGSRFARIVPFDKDAGDTLSIEFSNQQVFDGKSGVFAARSGVNTYQALPAAFSPVTSNNDVFFEPAAGEHSEVDASGNLLPFASVNYTVTSVKSDTRAGLTSTLYTIRFFVANVNDPPTAADISERTPMNTPVTVTLNPTDVDHDSALLSVRIVRVRSSEGSFADAGLPVTNGYTMTGRTLTYSPNPDTFSHPADVPSGSLEYIVIDPLGAESPVYTVQIFVDFQALPVAVKANRNVTTDEDTVRFFRFDRFGVDWFEGNPQFRDRASFEVSNIQGKGALAVCPIDQECVAITGAVPRGARLRYTPEPDSFGESEMTFDLTITLDFPVDVSTDVVTRSDEWHINVRPVNDPPVLVPGFFLAADSQENRCEEDTHFIVRFSATDIDHTPEELTGVFVQWLTESGRVSLYACDGTDGPVYDDAEGSCVAGTLIDGAALISSPTNDANFALVLVPDENYSGAVERFIVAAVDADGARSQSETVRVRIDPINDPPAFVTLPFERRQGDEPSQIVFITEVSDVDFLVGRELRLTGTVTAGEARFIDPAQAKCTLSEDAQSIVCQDIIGRLNALLGSGSVIVDAIGDFEITFEVNDLGNTDYRVPREAYALNATHVESFTAPVAIDAKTVSTDPTDNSLLIAGPLAGLAAALLIAFGVWKVRAAKAAAAVDNYFNNFALGMDGAVNTSPIYEGGTVGGENVLYTGD